jgi:Mce-associated membrane protein
MAFRVGHGGREPRGGITTVAYTLTIDKNAGWKITQVGGGLDDALPAK